MTKLTTPGAFVTPMYWFTIELSVASISISLPVIFHLIKRAMSHGPAALLNAKDYPTNSSRSNRVEGVAGDDEFVRLRNGAKHQRIHDTRLDRLESEERGSVLEYT